MLFWEMSRVNTTINTREWMECLFCEQKRNWMQAACAQSNLCISFFQICRSQVYVYVHNLSMLSQATNRAEWVWNIFGPFFRCNKVYINLRIYLAQFIRWNLLSKYFPLCFFFLPSQWKGQIDKAKYIMHFQVLIKWRWFIVLPNLLSTQ